MFVIKVAIFLLGNVVCTFFRPELDASALNQDFIELVFIPLINIDEHRELLAKSTDCEHVVSRVPFCIRHEVHQPELILLAIEALFKTGVPDLRLAALAT